MLQYAGFEHCMSVRSDVRGTQPPIATLLVEIEGMTLRFQPAKLGHFRL